MLWTGFSSVSRRRLLPPARWVGKFNLYVSWQTRSQIRPVLERRTSPFPSPALSLPPSRGRSPARLEEFFGIGFLHCRVRFALSIIDWNDAIPTD